MSVANLGNARGGGDSGMSTLALLDYALGAASAATPAGSCVGGDASMSTLTLLGTAKNAASTATPATLATAVTPA